MKVTNLNNFNPSKDMTTRMTERLRGADKIKVLFVCLGNICRSPAAEGIMRDVAARAGQADRWVIDSAGTGDWHVGDLPDARMRDHARRRGYDLTHRCRQITRRDFADFDLIIGMDENNRRNLLCLAPDASARDKIVMMADFFSPGTPVDHVPDPYYDGPEGFELAIDLLEDGTRGLLKALSL